jgi:mannose-6-phosphate isomerase-like protein (cupin superfamily)
MNDAQAKLMQVVAPWLDEIEFEAPDPRHPSKTAKHFAVDNGSYWTEAEYDQEFCNVARSYYRVDKGKEFLFFPRHEHTYHEFVYVESGRLVCLYDDGQEVELQIGAVHHDPPGTPHAWRMYGEGQHLIISVPRGEGNPRGRD